MSTGTASFHEQLNALRMRLDDVIVELDSESLHRDAFDAAVRKAQEYMRVCGDKNLELLADEIDEARTGIPTSFLKATKTAPSILDVLEDPNGPASGHLFPGMFKK